MSKDKFITISAAIGLTLIGVCQLSIVWNNRMPKEEKVAAEEFFIATPNPTIQTVTEEAIIVEDIEDATPAPTKKPKPKKKYKNIYTEMIEKMSNYEKNILYKITFLEAGNQCMDGQRAVIEVILNRVLAEDKPNSIVGVLSQRGEFTTWNMVNSAKYNKQQVKALKLVATKNPILNKEYLYFSTTRHSYAKNYIKIQGHWFGTR